MYAARTATQQAMATESMARELGVRLGAVKLLVDANAAIGIIDKQGQKKVKHADLVVCLAADSCVRNASRLQESAVRKQRGSLGTKAFEREAIEETMKKLKGVRFDQENARTHGRREERGEREEVGGESTPHSLPTS